MDVPYTYQYYPAVPLSDLSDLFSVGDRRLNNQRICIISYLPKILRIGIDFKTIENRYVLFMENTSSVDSITWTIQFYNKGKAFDDAGLELTGANTNDFVVSMNENLFNSNTKELLYDKL